MKFLVASRSKLMYNAIVEVSNDDAADKGSVELKVHNPSLDKKKSATLEIRKISDSEYSHVEKLRDIITTLLDDFLSGKESKHSNCSGLS